MFYFRMLTATVFFFSPFDAGNETFSRSSEIGIFGGQQILVECGTNEKWYAVALPHNVFD